LILRAFLQNDKTEQIGKTVFIGTPQTGAERADWWSRFRIYHFVTGPSGSELRTDSTVQNRLYNMRDTEFAIIAGGKGKDFSHTQVPGYLPILKGDNDGTITVESAWLSGAKAYAVVPHMHAFLVYSKKVKEMTVRFLQSGKFNPT
jgi:hypothetical protein